MAHWIKKYLVVFIFLDSYY